MSFERNLASEISQEDFKQLQTCPGLEKFDSQKTEISLDLRYRVLHNKHLKVQKVIQVTSG